MSNLGSRVFEALYAGWCANANSCDGIKAGDRIFFAKDADTPQHVPGECNYTDSLAAKQEICECCYIERSAAGRCDNCD